MNDLQKRIKALSPKQQELLLQRLNKQTGRAARTNREESESDFHPMPFGLQREWLLQQLEAQHPSYNPPVLLCIEGKLNISVLEQVLKLIMEHHHPLHMQLVEQNGRLVQKSLPSSLLDFQVINWQPPHNQDLKTAMLSWAEVETHKPFDLIHNPLWRVCLAQIHEKCHLLALTLHHSIYGRRNVDWLLQEVMQQYQETLPTDLRLTKQSIPPAMSANRIKGLEHEQKIRFWKKQLDQVSALSFLLNGKMRPPVQTFGGATIQYRIPAKFVEWLKAFSQQENVSLPITLLSAFQVLLAIYTGQKDLVVGVCFPNTIKSAEVKFFPDALILRSLVNNKLQFRELVAQTHRSYQEALDHYIPFEQLIDELLLEQSLNFPPLVQVLFDFRPLPPVIWEKDNIRVERLETRSVIAPYDLHLDIFESETELQAVWTYNTALISSEAAIQIRNVLEIILETITADPRQLLQDLHNQAETLFIHRLTTEHQQLIKTGGSIEKGISTLVDHATPAPPLGAPKYKTVVEEILAYFWAETLKTNDIHPEDDFYTLGGDSLAALRILAHIRKRFGIDLPITTMQPGVTLTRLIRSLHQQQGITPWFQMEAIQPGSPLVPIHPSGTKPPLFCAHPLGGDVGFYAMLTRYLGSDQPLYGLQAQGMDGLNPPVNNIEEMARNYIQAIRIIQPEGPFYFAGWSLGGLLSLEMARQLKIEGHEIALVAMFDTIADWIYLPVGQRKTQTRTQFLLEGFGKVIPISPEMMESLGQSEQLIYLLDELQKLGERPSGISILQWFDLFSVREQNLHAIYHYRPQPYQGKVVAFYALDSYLHDPTEPVKWSELTGADMEIELVTGDHINIFAEPHFRMLVEQFKFHLNNAQMQHASV